MTWIGRGRIFAMSVMLVACGDSSSTQESEPCEPGGELLSVKETSACVWDYAHATGFPDCSTERPTPYIYNDVYICADRELEEGDLARLRALFRQTHPAAGYHVCEAESLAIDSFEACGVTLDVLPAPQTSGWNGLDYASFDERPYPFRTPWLATAASGVIARGDNQAGLYVTDSDGAPLAVWAPTSSDYNYLGGANEDLRVEAAGDTIAIISSGGVSVLSWDGGVPSERFCVAKPYTIVDLSERWLSVTTFAEGGPPLSEVYDNTTGNVIGTVEPPFEAGPVLVDDRLVSTNNAREAVLYEVSIEGVVELARTADPGLGDRPFESAGFVWSEALGAAVDITEDTLETHPIRQNEDDPCLMEVEVDGTTVYFRPEFFGESATARYTTLEDVPDSSCLASGRPFSSLSFARQAAAEPGGARILHDNGLAEEWTLMDTSTGASQAFQFSSNPVAMAWMGDVVKVGYSAGSDWNIPIEFWVESTTEESAGWSPPSRIDFPGPFVASATTAQRMWVVSEGNPRDYGDPETAPAARKLFVLEASTTTLPTPVDLPEGFVPLELAAYGDVGWLLGRDSRIVRVSDAGVEEIRGTTGLLFAESEREDLHRISAGPYGLFAVDDSGQSMWVTTSSDTARIDPSCTDSRPLGALGEDLLLLTRRPGGLGVSGYWELLRIELQTQGESFEATVTARLPVSQNAFVVPLDTGAMVVTGGLPTIR